MKIPWTVVAVLAVNSLTASTQKLMPADALGESRRWSASIETDVRERLSQLDLPFEARYDLRVRDLIKDYTVNGYRDTELMLGRTQHYFPVFEHYLKLNNIPAELKYLPIVETGLAPRSYSGAGAAGLWQFIPSSARMYGLKINYQVDERLDTYRSTEAAAKMLSELFKQYKSWPLVLAAYNCGPTRVNQAIRSAGCRDFWELRNYLPRETQDYIPRFIAAAYVANYYSDHGLQPRYNKRWPVQARVLKLKESLTFGELSFASGINVDLIRKLNPSYHGSRIPADPDGNFLILPGKSVSKVKDYICSRNGGNCMDPVLLYPNFHKIDYVVRPGETMRQIADRFNCTTTQIKEWNQLDNSEVFVMQEIFLYLPDAQYSTP